MGDTKGSHLIYVKTENKELRYKECIFPGAIRIQKKRIDKASAIVFDKENKTISTGTAILDYEFMQILTKIACHFGFDEKNKENILMHKLKDAAPEDLTMDEIQMLINMAQDGKRKR